MRRIKWFVPAHADDPYNLFGVVDYAATLYGRRDGFTLPASTGPTDPQERAAANRAFWEAAPVPAQPGLLARLLRGRTRP
ncbi:hypothetical protein ABZ807_31470 [Micromonospora sp. NPDC047548]|uniref:hypothetical protein n=1 Tax=Micromonospora sp. NPDC047548 TaxID=3155624 RepID=UPI0033FBD642